MKKTIIILFALSCVLFSASASFCQFEPGVLQPESGSGFLIGPIGGINLVTYSTEKFSILQSEPACFQAQNGSGIAPFFGVTAALPLGVNMKNFIIIEAIYDSKSSKFTSENGNRTDVPTKLNGQVGNGNISTTLKADLSYLILNGGYKYNFTEASSPVGPSVMLAVSVGIKLSSTLDKTIVVSAVNGSSTVTDAQPVDGAQGIRIALRPMFAYDIPLSPTWIASPTVGYDFPVTKVDNTDRKWGASAAWAGVALRYFIR